MTKDKKIGYLLTIFGAVCWAFSGACGQYLFLTRSMTANMLVAIRLTAAGLLTVLYTLCRQKKRRGTHFPEPAAHPRPADLCDRRHGTVPVCILLRH